MQTGDMCDMYPETAVAWLCVKVLLETGHLRRVLEDEDAGPRESKVKKLQRVKMSIMSRKYLKYEPSREGGKLECSNRVEDSIDFFRSNFQSRQRLHEYGICAPPGERLARFHRDSLSACQLVVKLHELIFGLC